MQMYKESGMGAVIMVNSNEGFPIQDEIERAIAREYEWPGYFPEEKIVAKVSPDILDTYVGEYVGKSGFQCTVTKQNGTLLLKPMGQADLELHPQSETKFFVTELNTEVTFEKTEKGEINGLTLHQDGKPLVIERKR